MSYIYSEEERNDLYRRLAAAEALACELEAKLCCVSQDTVTTDFIEREILTGEQKIAAGERYLIATLSPKEVIRDLIVKLGARLPKEVRFYLWLDEQLIYNSPIPAGHNAHMIPSGSLNSTLAGGNLYIQFTSTSECLPCGLGVTLLTTLSSDPTTDACGSVPDTCSLLHHGTT